MDVTFSLTDVGSVVTVPIHGARGDRYATVQVIMVVTAPKGICAIFSTPYGDGFNDCAEEQALAVGAFVAQHRDGAQHEAVCGNNA